MIRTIAFPPMPTYVYKFVDTGETIEVQQAFTDDTLTTHVHPSTGESMPVKKVFQPVGVTFKGSGFYKTDSRGGSAKSSGGNGSGDSSGSSSEGPTGDSSSTSSGDSKDSGTKESGTKESATKESGAASGTASSSTSTSTPTGKSSGSGSS